MFLATGVLLLFFVYFLHNKKTKILQIFQTQHVV